MIDIIVDIVKAIFSNPGLTAESFWLALGAVAAAVGAFRLLHLHLDWHWAWGLLVGVVIAGGAVFYPYGWHIAMGHDRVHFYTQPNLGFPDLRELPTTEQMWQQITVRSCTMLVPLGAYLWFKVKENF
jgi:hypothetical protein